MIINYQIKNVLNIYNFFMELISLHDDDADDDGDGAWRLHDLHVVVDC